MKKQILASSLLSFLLFQSCATKAPFSGADKTASTWDAIYECIRTAPEGKSCGSQFKSHTYTAKVSSIQKDETGHTQLISRFGSGDKAFKCEIPAEKAEQFAAGDIIQFEGTVTGITAKPMQRAIEFDNCNLRKTATF